MSGVERDLHFSWVVGRLAFRSEYKVLAEVLAKMDRQEVSYVEGHYELQEYLAEKHPHDYYVADNLIRCPRCDGDGVLEDTEENDE